MREYGLALEAVFGIGIRLQALLDSSTPSNFVVSPVSATVIVTQLLLGAEGEFRRQLYDLLSLPGHAPYDNLVYYNRNKRNETCVVPYALMHLHVSSMLRKLQKRKTGELYTLNLANALFYNKDIQLRNCFRRSMAQFYDSQINPLDFSQDTSSTINSWASANTNGLIKTIVQGPPPPTTSSIFLNSIYFKAQWETPFSDQLNTIDAFYTQENTTVDTTYMLGLIENILYADTKDYRMICLPYKNRELGMYILLPKTDNPYKFNSKEFIKQLDPSEVLQVIATAPLRDVVVKIPKLSLSNNLKLLEPLQKYAQFKKQASRTQNVKATQDIVHIVNCIEHNVENFKNFTPDGTPEIYLSGAADNANMLVSDIIQQIVFSINEEGTEAAAVTAGITDYMGGSKTMVLNRPFTFFIRHEPTFATLFWGSIVDPSRN
ncbi:hypothetical protein NQ315_011798 [Exocentrus adspersus]|uniref:Serpin domain-containing protein n=1 Tax=Exocentrus adspersus TaxID=1586481 RepID=A0AAV8W0P3_9CUCU|nr:hypothetical protein NQ315_011798 [Exocentrus adspersus]